MSGVGHSTRVFQVLGQRIRGEALNHLPRLYVAVQMYLLASCVAGILDERLADPSFEAGSDYASMLRAYTNALPYTYRALLLAPREETSKEAFRHARMLVKLGGYEEALPVRNKALPFTLHFPII